MVIPSVTDEPDFRHLIDRLDGPRGIIEITGLWGSSAPLVCASLANATQSPLLYVTAHLDEADEVQDDLETFAGRSVKLLPAWEALPGEGSAGGEIHGDRLRLCSELRTPGREIIVAPIQAILQPVPTSSTLDANTLRLAPGHRLTPEHFVDWLVQRGFERLDRVESPGDFARRGDIIDVFPPSQDNPVRLEFFDDTVEAIREIDLSTQRSTGSLKSWYLPAIPINDRLEIELSATFLSYLPADTIIVLDRAGDVQEAAQTFFKRVKQPDRLVEPASLFRAMSDFHQLHVTRVGGSSSAPGDTHSFHVGSLTRFEGRTEGAVDELCRAADDHRIVVYCHADGERTRLRELIVEYNGAIPDSVEFVTGIVHHGFEWLPSRTIVVPHHEIFHRQPPRKLRRTHAMRPIESALELVPGDYVVHVVHGIARFRGMRTIKKGESNKSGEFMTLEFADRAALHVPTTQVDLVQKYIGAGGIKPTLTKLGGSRWAKTKDKVADAVSELAESLLRVQAARAEHEGVAYPADTAWQREFEESFPYEDTEDQTTVSAEVKSDLCRRRPMDRLICGDVGYGKTELAIRAAFKVVEYGKQVAVLVPTTVLAEQHFRTFSERLADYPFTVGCLSRFRSGAEQKKLIERVKKGQVDVLIGTHRLLSKDVGFADLGLVIVDEEQRFGVEHKERLKYMRETVDVLTMSATPIPRTLHMSMVGLRDISSLQSPPMDRRAIATRVCSFSGDVIRSAIVRELNRDGQVYFIHNIVRSIESIADRVRLLVPEARVIVGHGQMREGQLEKVMHAFVNRKADILVATTIIESGIDIPSVNTIFINNADRFGLADLHQLRGRVGRSTHRGYCYFLLSADRPVLPKAAKRLKAIEEFSDLGAGFRIAMRDLEIRGAGNLLGPEQSGNIAAVGYEMYCQLLERTVRRLRGDPDTAPLPVHLELDIAAHIPRSYISAERTRIDVYRRIAACATATDVEQMETDLRDAFGKYPAAVQRLIELAEIRVLAAAWGIRSIIMHKPDLVFAVPNLKCVDALFSQAPGSVRAPDGQTIHWRLPPNYLESGTLLATLRQLLSRRAVEATVACG